MYNPIGKTLAEVARETNADFFNGYSIFLLQDKNDTTGKWVDESYSVRAILKEHPEISDYVVKLENNFYGTNVLRAIDKDRCGVSI